METLKEIWEEIKVLSKNFLGKNKKNSIDLWGKLKSNSYYQMASITLFLQVFLFIMCCLPAVKISFLGLETDMVKDKMSVLGWMEETPVLRIITIGILFASMITVGWIFSEKETHKVRRFIIAKLSVPYIAFWSFMLIGAGYSGADTYKSWGAKSSITFSAILAFITMIVLFVMLFVLSSKSKKLNKVNISEKIEIQSGEKQL